MAATPCLVLLGEPGIGKSHELKLARLTEESRGGVILPCDLRAFSTDALLCSRLFGSAEFEAWQEGTGRLCLFLDSLDEGLLRIDTLAALLTQELNRYPVDRLTLRIACRTAEWPHSLEDELKRLWGDANVGIFELVPLRRNDVQAAAKAEGVDPKSFLQALHDKQAVPLAIKPVTLRMLMNLYKKTGAFPPKQADLYDQGCRLLCAEPNEGRRDVGLRSSLSADVLLAVASRIAAVTVFGNRYVVWTDIDTGDVPLEDVTVRQLAGEVTEDAIRETVKTGLFSSRGPHRMGWAHQTYAEFLAARYVVTEGMTQEQVLSLIIHPDDPGQRLVPQLHETAAWIAGMRNDVFKAIMDRDPEVLLRSDVAAAESDDRKRLVGALMALYAEEKFTPQSLDLQGHYAKLGHPGLADQLRLFVVDKKANWLVRRVAIDIAEACKVEELVPELVRIALDRAEDIQVRKNAAHAVVKAGDTAAKAQLKPLALGQAGYDSDDNLKGCVLMGLWPDLMTPQELFQSLTPRALAHSGGYYGWFRFNLSSDLPTRLRPEDLVHALNWVSLGYAEDHDVTGLCECVMLKAWDVLDHYPELVQPFAQAAVTRLRNNDLIAEGAKEHPFAQRIREDKASLVFKAADSIEGMGDADLMLLAYAQTPLFVSDDVPWLAEQLGNASPEARRRWGQLIELVFDRGNTDHVDLVLKVRHEFHDLAAIFHYMDAVEIESEVGRKMKADYLRHKRRMIRLNARRSRPLLTPPPKDRVLALLDTFEAGDPNAWWRLNLEMTLEPNSQHYGGELEWDLTVLPGWRDADGTTRARIIAAARRYVASPPPMDQSWLGTNTVYRPAFAGYRALALLHTAGAALPDVLNSEAWVAWVPIVIAYPLDSDQWNKAPHTDLVRLAYERASDAILVALNTFWWESERLGHCWDDHIAAVLLAKVRTLGTPIDHVRSLLYQLLKHGYDPAVEYARSLVVIPQPLDATARATIMAAAEVLLVYCQQSAWDRLWPVIKGDSGFGRDLFEQVAHIHDEQTGGLGARLAANEVADLYLWLAAQYPHKEDPHYEDAHSVGPRESIALFREGLLTQLKNRGTPEACEQVRRIARELPHLAWLKWTVQEAEAQTRRQTWKPLEPHQILALAQDRQRRYVENGWQLLDVLVESLNHLQAVLQGETPAAMELWDNRGNAQNEVWCPVDELRLSDWIARHLREHLSGRGIVINREVQICRSQDTDIHVDAIVPGKQSCAASAVSAIIEVKGCWHGELETAMETQLVGRYLNGNQCPNGLYLIGWFNCDKWSACDYRKQDASRWQLTEIRTRFASQAERLQGRAAVPRLALRAVVLDITLK